MASLKEILKFCVKKNILVLEQAKEIFKLGIDGLNKWGTSLCRDSGGYPLLHLICNKVNPEFKDKCPFLKQASELIALGGNPNIFDQHGFSPLHWAAAEGKKHLVKMLIRAKADPNLVSQHEKCTALEYAIDRSYQTEFHPLIRYLYNKTRRDERMNKSFQESFDDAKDRWYDDQDLAQRINIMMELKLVPFEIQDNSFVNECENFARGCWIRVVRYPDEEIVKLNKRAKLTPAELAREDQKTRYSSATFVKAQIPISLFVDAKNFAGFILRRVGKPIDYWYDGHTEVVTDGYKFNDPAQFDNGQASGQYRKVSEDTIEAALEKILYLSKQKFRKEQLDRFGVIEQMYQQNQYFRLRWNEGIFCYKREDIVGIYVDPNNKKSVSSALKLRHCLDLKVPLYHYQSDGNCKRIASADLRKFYTLNSDGSTISVSSQRDTLFSKKRGVPSAPSAVVPSLTEAPKRTRYKPN